MPSLLEFRQKLHFTLLSYRLICSFVFNYLCSRRLSLRSEYCVFTRRYKCSHLTALRDATNNIVSNSVSNSQTDSEHQAAAFLGELPKVRDRKLRISCLSADELSSLILYALDGSVCSILYCITVFNAFVPLCMNSKNK